MKISEIYKEYVRDGMNKDKAAGICLGIMTSGLIDASDEETYSKLKQEFIAKQNESDDEEVWRAESVDRNPDSWM